MTLPIGVDADSILADYDLTIDIIDGGHACNHSLTASRKTKKPQMLVEYLSHYAKRPMTCAEVNNELLQRMAFNVEEGVRYAYHPLPLTSLSNMLLTLI